MNEEAVKKRTKKMKENHRTPEFREMERKIRLNQIFPLKDTSIEVTVQQELASRNIQFQKHYPVIGQPDIAFLDKKIAIFCDGDYWHNRLEQVKRDTRVNEQLRNAGWLVLRYWEHEINANVEGVVDKIEEVLRWI